MNEFWIALDWLNGNVASRGAEAALRAGYSGAVLGVMVLAVNLVFRRWLTASQMLVLWGLVLARMALPIAPSSPASIHNSLIRLMSESSAWESVATAEGPPRAYAFRPAAVAVQAAEAGSPELGAAVTREGANLGMTIDDWIPLLWLAGAVIVLGWTLGTHWRFTWRTARVDRCGDERLLSLWRRCREELGLRRGIPIVVCDEVPQPAVMGVWRAKLLLPRHCVDWTDEQLRLVMLHELMHVRCWDVAINWLLVLVRAAQWWNPFFWLSQSRFVNLREQSRDAMVLRHVNGDGRNSRAYADLLLSQAARGARQGWRVMLPASLLGFLSGWFRKRGVANRLIALAHATRAQRRGHRVVVVVATLALGLIGLTDASQRKPATEPVYSDAWKRIAEGTVEPSAAAPSDAVPGGPNVEPSGPWSEQEYDVTRGAAIIMRQKGCDAEELSKLLRWDLGILADPTRLSGSVTDKAVTAAEPRRSSRKDTTHGVRKVDPEPSSDRGRAELRRDGERWVVHATGPESMHLRIRQTVHAWNRSGWGQVTIETRIATTQRNLLDVISLDSFRFKAGTVGNQADDESDKEAAEALRVESDATAVAVSTVEHHIPVLVAVLTDEQTRRFVQAAQGSAGSNIMSAPKVTMLNGQRARAFSGVQRPFVVGVKERSDGGLESQVRIVDEGFDLSLRPELIENHEGVDLAARLDLSDTRDVQEFSTRIRGKDVTVQVPSVRHTRVQTTARLQDNRTLLLCVPPTYDQKHYAWVLLTARIFPERDAVTPEER